jgi:hypothetical protein
VAAGTFKLAESNPPRNFVHLSTGDSTREQSPVPPPRNHLGRANVISTTAASPSRHGITVPAWTRPAVCSRWQKLMSSNAFNTAGLLGYFVLNFGSKSDRKHPIKF